MEIKFIATIIIALLNIFLGIYIFKRNSSNPGNRNYAGLCISGGLWAIFMALLYFINNNQFAYFFLKGTYIFAILPPLFYLLFAYHYPYRLWNYPPIIIKSILFLSVILELFFVSGLLDLQSAKWVNGVLEQNVFFNDFLLFAIYFFGYVFWGLVILIKKFRRIEGVYRIRVQYLIIATILTFIIIGIISIVLPLFNNFYYDNLGPIFILLHFAVVGYLLFYKVNRD